jgi:PAS domain S-box-containing protein
MPPRRWVLDWKVTLGYVVVAAAVAATGWAAIRQLRAARAADDRARTTVDILRQVSEVEIALLGAESAQRGYLLTGEDAYLEPYRRADEKVGPRLAALEEMVADSPQQRLRVATVRELAASKMAELEQTLALWRAASPEAARQVVNTHVGKGIMGRITALLGDVAAEERTLLARLVAERQSSFWWAGRVGLASSIVALLVVMLSTLATNDQVRWRAAAERSLRENEQWLHVTLRSIGDAVIATDAAGRVALMNEGAQRLTGWSERDARGRALADVFRVVEAGSGDSAESPVARVLREGAVSPLADDSVLLARDGRATPIDDCGAPIRDAAGAVIGVVLVFRDVSEQRRQAQQQEQLQREAAARATAERDSRTKDEFLAILSHELRSPLQGILGWLTVLREKRADRGQQERALQAIEAGVRQQAQLVNDVLDVSRIVAGKLQLATEPVDISAVVEECVDQATPQAREKGLAIDSAVAGCGVVLGDRHRLHQSVSNLIANAVKFTPAGGRVEVRCARDGDSMRIIVRDSGQGIAPEFLPHIFDRFTQAAAGPRPLASGLGLGLSIVRQIADVHGGSVSAESEGLGRGATFTLRLPVAPHAERDRSAAPAAAMPAARSTLAGLSILLVDDDLDTCESLALLLESRGAAVRHVASAAAALDDCRRRAPDVIISDISMPEQDGYALIDAVRACDACRPQPVAVALTGFAADRDRDRAAAAGFDAHVSKPVDFDDLVHTILALTADAGGNADASLVLTKNG